MWMPTKHNKQVWFQSHFISNSLCASPVTIQQNQDSAALALFSLKP